MHELALLGDGGSGSGCGRGGGGGRADGGVEAGGGGGGVLLLLLGLADLGVALGELEADGLGQVRVEPNPLLQGKRRELGGVAREKRGREVLF